MVAVGIDLGTTYSCVAVWRHNCVEVIANDQGSRTTPSYVSFTSTHRFIGESAKKLAAFNPSNTVFSSKRLIGRRYDDVGLQMDLRHLPFKVMNEKCKPMIVVDYKGERKKFAPEEISAMTLSNMKHVAEVYLEESVSKAVITVPAYFNDSQRAATRAAGELAGLDVLKILNEPTAAALAYGLDKKLKDKNVLIYDLGGGTIDVSVLTVTDNMFEVKSTAANTRLGGEDFDNRCVAYFAEDFRKRFNLDITSNLKALRRLKSAAETAKMFLTSASEALVHVKSLFSDIDYSGKISRALFEELCSDLFKDTLVPLKKVLKDAKLQKSDIDRVVLAGGSTRIPKIRSLIKEFFGNVPIMSSINPEEAIASGAAIHAAALDGPQYGNIKNLLLIDVVPLSLGVETARGMMYNIIERNTPIPCARTKDLTTLEDYQNSMTIEIYEGERTLTKDNTLLGVFDLNGIPPAPRGIAKIDVTFDVDFNGILNVMAKDRITGSTKSVTIRNEHRTTQTEIAKMMTDAEIFREEDKENKRRLEARNQLENYVFGARQTVKDNSSILSDHEKTRVLKDCQKATEWLDDNADTITEEFERKLTELMRSWSGVMSKILNQSRRFKRQRSDSYQVEI